MPDLYIFKAQIGMFDPVALHDQNVRIIYGESRYIRRVDYIEAIPPFQCIDLVVASGAVIPATAPTAKFNATNLEAADHEFALFRWYPIDDAQILLFHPSGVSKAQLRNLQVPYDMNIIFRDPNLVSTEIAVWQNNRPAFSAINGHAFALNALRIIALGYRFHTVDLESGKCANSALVNAINKGESPVTNVYCSGRAIGE